MSYRFEKIDGILVTTINVPAKVTISDMSHCILSFLYNNSAVDFTSTMPFGKNDTLLKALYPNKKSVVETVREIYKTRGFGNPQDTYPSKIGDKGIRTKVLNHITNLFKGGN